MASSRKPPSADPALAAGAFLADVPVQGKKIIVGLSGGMDSVVLLHALAGLKSKVFTLSALHVHHGLSPSADAWAKACARLCKSLKVPLTVKRVRVARMGEGLEAAARAARYQAFREARGDAIALAHHLDDQAETVLFNLLRGAGARGLSGMPGRSRLDGKLLLRPLLEVPRAAIERYAVAHKLHWVEDESNADTSFTRNFLRREVAPLLATRFPQWRESVSRAARLAARRHADAGDLLRDFLRARGLRAPSEAKLLEMLRQLGSGSSRTRIAHDGKLLRAYRGRVEIGDAAPLPAFEPTAWKGEARLALPALGGVVTFRRAGARTGGFDARLLKRKPFSIRLRSGGERLQPDPKRPRRTLKNLFQEAGVPPHRRERTPLLFCGDELVWVPGLGVDARYQARGTHARVPRWSPKLP
jgi:tRNA(Ile)-lysidine synthase